MRSTKYWFVGLMLAFCALSAAVPAIAVKGDDTGNSGSGKHVSGKAHRQQARQQASAASDPAPVAAVEAPSDNWESMVGDVVGALGIGGLLAQLGLTGPVAELVFLLLSVVLSLVFAFVGVRFLRRLGAFGKPKPAIYFNTLNPNTHYPKSGAKKSKGERAEPNMEEGGTVSSASRAKIRATYVPQGVPGDFDATGFLRATRVYFIRLQVAWDSAGIDDIREFTTPEICAAFTTQLIERGQTNNHSDVLALESELLGVETLGKYQVASVRFTGTIKESCNEQSENFTEVWNLSKRTSGNGGWILAGIQQYFK